MNTGNYRNRKLLNAAKNCPMCMLCGKVTDGTIVAAHSNQQRDGKGMGIKAHDYRVAYICHNCHNEIDNGKLTRQEAVEKWEEAHRKSIAWLFDTGIIGG